MTDDDTNKNTELTSTDVLYEVINPSMFRTLVSASGVEIESIRKDDAMVCRIANEEFAKECIKSAVVRVYKEKRARRITSPENLILRIVKVEKEITGDDYIYTIKTIDGDVRITSDDIMSITAWKQKFFKIGYVITFNGSNQNASDLSDMLMFLSDYAIITSEELMTEDEMKSDIFMQKLRSLNVVLSDEDHVSQRNVLDADGKYVVSSATIECLISELGWHHMSLNKLGALLKDYKIGNNRQVRRCGYRRSEWRFKPW